MEKINVYKTSEVYSIKDIKRLSIVDSIDSLYFFCYTGQKEILEVNRIPLKRDLSQILKAIYAEYGEIEYTLYYTDLDFEIIPRKLFLYGEESTYLQHISIQSKKNIFFVDQCTEEQLVIIYSVSAEKDIKYREIFRGLHTYHIATSICKADISNAQQMVLYLFKGLLIFIKREDQKLQSVTLKHSTVDTSYTVLKNGVDTLNTEDNLVYVYGDLAEFPFIKDHISNVQLDANANSLFSHFLKF